MTEQKISDRLSSGSTQAASSQCDQQTNTALVAQGVSGVQLDQISKTLHDAAAQNDLIAEGVAPAVEDFLANDLERKILSRIDLNKVVASPKPLEVVDLEAVKAMFPKAPSTTALTLPQSLSPSVALLPGEEY